jgi:two-component system sensor histidine kinase AlgZ
MHPAFKNRTNFLLYLAVWIPLGGMLSTIVEASGRLTRAEAAAVAVPVTIVLAFVALSPWYTCRGLPFDSTPAWKLASNHLAAMAVAASLVLVFARMTAAGLADMFPHLERGFPPAIPTLAAMVSLVYLLSIAFHYVLLAVESSRKAEILARAAELKALKSQLNPHFLFNCLNSISALTSIDAERARDMCVRLADFLRTSLRLGECTAIKFSEEMELARMYLDVEQVRFGGRLRVTVTIDAECEGCEVPPLLVQPLVENAIKHGIATMVDGGEVTMTGRYQDGEIRFTIENPFDPEAPAARNSGIGLRNVRERLLARYGNAARVEIAAEPGRYVVRMTIPGTKETR